MKKLVVSFLIVLTMAFTQSVQAQSNFDLNRDFKDKLTPVSVVYDARVVKIGTYLSIREYPNVHSRELARIPNGTYLVVRYDPYNPQWYKVVMCSAANLNEEGYVNAAYIKLYHEWGT